MEEFELDDKMTEETKLYVTNSLKVSKPSNLIVANVEITRKMRALATHKTNASLKFEKIIEKEIKVRNRQDGYEIPVSVYIPKDIKPNSPITVYYHGGGWTFGSRETSFYSVASLVESTKTVWISVEYRLCPENKFPIPLIDCQSVLEYVAENKKLFSFENARLGICGDSAGAHYCALLSNDHSHLIDYQILIYPAVLLNKSIESERLFTKECYILTPEVIDWFIKNLTDSESLVNLPALSPILKEDFTKIPETLIIAAELDPLVDHSKHYFKRLQENNIKSVLKIIKGVPHGFFSHPILMKNSFTELQNEVVDYFENI